MARASIGGVGTETIAGMWHSSIVQYRQTASCVMHTVELTAAAADTSKPRAAACPAMSLLRTHHAKATQEMLISSPEIRSRNGRLNAALAASPSLMRLGNGQFPGRALTRLSAIIQLLRCGRFQAETETAAVETVRLLRHQCDMFRMGAHRPCRH